MSQEKRLPQVGDVWFRRNGWKAKILSTTECGQPVKAECLEGKAGYSYHEWDGFWKRSKSDTEYDLILIHSDSTGKVINPTFNGGAPMHPQPKTKPAKADPVAQAIAEAQERLDGLKALALASQELANRRGDVKLLAAREKELRAKWMPEGKKAGKKVK